MLWKACRCVAAEHHDWRAAAVDVIRNPRSRGERPALRSVRRDNIADSTSTFTGHRRVQDADRDIGRPAAQHLHFRRNPEGPVGLVDANEQGGAAAERDTVRYADLHERQEELVDADCDIGAGANKRSRS